MAIGKILKIGGTVLAAAGGIAGGVEVVTTVVEQYNYNQVHEINITDTYLINGVEVDYETFIGAKENLDGQTTNTRDENIEVLAEGATTFYYGALDELPTSLSSLTVVNFDNMPATFTKHITAGHGEGRYAVGQYVILAIPETYKISYWYTTESLFGLDYEKIDIGSYDVYYLSEAIDDSSYGGTTYIWEFTK